MTINDLNLCIVDIETTGAGAPGNRIIEIAAIKIVKGEQVDQFHSLINPQRPIPYSISEFTGISDEDVKDAPIFEDIHRQLWHFLEGHIFIAHNVTFDYGFIRQEFDRLGMPFNLDRFCSVKLSKTLFPHYPKHDLSSIVERYNIPLRNRHRALDDALGVWEFLRRAQREVGADQWHAGLSKVLRTAALLPKEFPINVDGLPHALGVYMFYGGNDTLLYVGKANDIRSKVCDQVMNNPKLFSKEGCAIKRVEFIETKGKLGASLLEAHLIKKYHPVFNRRFKALDQMTTLSMVEDDAGYKRVVLNTHKSIRKEDLAAAYTVFRTRRLAVRFLEGIAQKYNIGRAFLGLEPCPASDRALEKPVIHNMRLIEALSKHRKMNWLFPGAIVIEESNALKTKGEAFVVDQWIIQEMIVYHHDANNELFKMNAAFDFDIYRILFNHLNKNKVKILNVTPRHMDSI